MSTGGGTVSEPGHRFLVSLLGLSGMTPARLTRILSGRSPEQAWARVLEGHAFPVADGARPIDPSTTERLSLFGPPADREEADPEGLGGPAPGEPGNRGRLERSRRQVGPEADAALSRQWAGEAARTDPASVLGRYERAGVSAHLLGWASYPPLLAAEVTPPPVICARGEPACLIRPRVALVGTRSCTHYGREVAAELGAELSRAGVVVVSGLARGIDGAAHEGALAGWEEGGAPPVGVTGSGLDVVYPPGHARLWTRVASAGALLSEAPLGARPEAWRFPWRNRLLAALSQVVVVVESHLGGGSMLTVDAAARRGVPVMAVPGSIRSPASAGTNTLLAEGCAPVRDTADVLAALGLSQAGTMDHRGIVMGGPGIDGVAATGFEVDQTVLKAVGHEPTTTEDVLRRTGLGLGQAAAALDRLEEAGLVRGGDGWWERRTPSAGRSIGQRIAH
ncbi:MAG: DNA-processing protein DprA [Acidimicrobiales bacterium]|nr:DNA-processing protein DprA [Acidimicrobiales bacterium]